MKAEEKYNNRTWLYKVLCAAAGMIASLPIACNYIMSGGRVTEWIARVTELAAGFHSGELYFFPQMETLAGTGIWGGGVNSNFWFFLPGVIVWLTGNITAAYRIYMLLIQIGTLAASMLFFQEVFAEEENRLPAFFGTLLYMVCPYRIFVCYDLADFSQAVAFALLPLYAWAVLRVFAGEGKWKKIIFMGVVLAGVGYADTVFFVALSGITLLVCICCRKIRGLFGLAAGVIPGIPALYRLGIYVFGKGLPEFDVMLRSIMSKGYRPGQYFSSYFWREDHPGMGLGMLICLLTVLWMGFVKGERQKDRRYGYFAWTAVFFTVLSLRCFPWDLVQRLGGWALRLVSMIETPAVFWGMACFAFCVPAAWGMGKMSRQKDKLTAFAVPFIVLLACVWICVYQCNMLTYSRMPVTMG